VNYDRLQPKTAATEGPVVLGIAIRRADDTFQTFLEAQAAARSYSGPEAVAALQTWTRVEDGFGSEDFLASLVAPMTLAEAAVHGPILYGAANAWPNGDDAPLPPPRRLGEEVYGA
jgi:hypothetical protein